MVEKFDILNEQGELLGKVATRDECHEKGFWHRAVYAFIIDENVSHIIKKIFDMILEGKSRREVANFLNDNEILTPSEYLKINMDKDTTIMKKWNPEMVNSILRNEIIREHYFKERKEN